MKNLVELYCDVDDFCKVFIPQWQKQLLEDGSRQRRRDSRMSMGEMMTVVIGFHMSHHRDFKNYYLRRVYGLPRYCKSKHAVLTKMVCVRISGFSLKYFHFEPR